MKMVTLQSVSFAGMKLADLNKMTHSVSCNVVLLLTDFSFRRASFAFVGQTDGNAG